jgi:squalene-associated FAD-dependent desaturase
VSGTVHIIGAGLAGLSAAVRLADEGARVALYEAARQAGGRCRSYHDPALDLVIDNGNHLVLSGNHATLDYVSRIGARAALGGPDEPLFHFADATSGLRWTMRPNRGRVPWWIFAPRRRVPGTRARDYLGILKLFLAPKSRTLHEAVDHTSRLYERLWHPLFVAALNTDPREASASLAAAVVAETFMAGGDAYRPLVATGTLAAAFVDPAVAHLERHGAAVRFNARLRALEAEAGIVRKLVFGDTTVPLAPDDRVIVAVPPWDAAELLPGTSVPDAFHGIVNAHFRVAPPAGQPPILGIVNGLTEWLFAFPDRLSVTISHADRLMDEPREKLAEAIWREVAVLTGLAPALPPWQIVREKRATFSATPAQVAKRPGPPTQYRNVVLAGDWTATGLPATIEGAVRSGYAAAELVRNRD